jgi:ribosome-binding protein aMBF1 (putative translation factor)
MARTTMRELHARRLAEMTTEQRAVFDESYRSASLAARVGELIRDARTDAGLTQRQMAERMGTTQAVVARIETGSVGATLTSLQRAADALDRNIEIRMPLKSAS